MSDMTSATLARVVAATVWIGMLAGNWDAWYHRTLGRLSSWEPPHLLLYATAAFAIVCAVYGRLKFGTKGWKRLSAALALMLLSAPLDAVWHGLFGVETVASPLIVWSPPHVFYIVSMIVASAFALAIVREDKDEHARFWFGAMLWSSVMNPLFFLAGPLIPGGPFALMGAWGAAVPAAIFAAVLLLARRWSGKPFTAVSVTLFFLALGLMTAGEKISPISGYPAHGFPPVWLVIFSMLIPAAFLEAAGRLPAWARGAGAGFLMTVVMYVCGASHFDPPLLQTAKDAAVGVLAGTFGGFLAGALTATPRSWPGASRRN